MEGAAQFGVARPSYGAIRRALLPIYASDQLIFFILIALPFIWLATVNSRLALYTGVGAYIGAMLTMQRSTPSSLLLDVQQQARVIELLDSSRFLTRTGSGLEWVSTYGRLKRWSTDKITVQQTTNGVLVTGRLIDLQIIAHQMKG
jgi:hypothetical protein